MLEDGVIAEVESAVVMGHCSKWTATRSSRWWAVVLDNAVLGDINCKPSRLSLLVGGVEIVAGCVDIETGWLAREEACGGALPDLRYVNLGLGIWEPGLRN